VLGLVAPSWGYGLERNIGEPRAREAAAYLKSVRVRRCSGAQAFVSVLEDLSTCSDECLRTFRRAAAGPWVLRYRACQASRGSQGGQGVGISLSAGMDYREDLGKPSPWLSARLSAPPALLVVRLQRMAHLVS
jgi:hypothetical protein